MKSFWSSLFGNAPAHDRFSLEELQYLHSTLLRNPVVNDSNRDTVVEALRSIAELVIWGDQHDSNMVEYFLTENLLAHFNQILQQRSNRRGNVAMQVLQTLSILIQNLRNQQTVYYLFSNNHINEIVSMRFDFDDDEVLGYYVNLLKTISLKLNETTVQFFFHAGGAPGGGRARGGSDAERSPSAARPPSFPLYTESIKFVNHRDPMVRTAVKTLTLNVYGIRLPAVQQFVTSRPAAAYFAELAAFISEQCRVLDRLLSSWDVVSPQCQSSAEACLAEVEDLLSYCNDVLATGMEPLRELLLDCLWQELLGPVLFWPLIQEDVAVQHIAALTLGTGGAGVGSLAASAGTAGRGAVADAALQRGTVGPLCSLCVFERLFLAITDQQLLTVLVAALLGGASCGSSSATPSPSSSRPGSPGEQQQRSTAPAEAAVVVRWEVPPALLARLQYSPAAYRQAVLGMLRGSDPQVAAAAVRVLASLLQNRAVSEEQLELVGLLPQRRRKQRQLLQALVGDSPMNSRILEPPTEAAVEAGDSKSLQQENQQQQQQEQGQLEPSSSSSAQSLSQQQQQQQPPGAFDVDSMQDCNGSSFAPCDISSSPSSSRTASRHSSCSSDSGARVQLSISEAADGSLSVRLQASRQQGNDTVQVQLQQEGERQEPGGQVQLQQQEAGRHEGQQQQQQMDSAELSGEAQVPPGKLLLPQPNPAQQHLSQEWPPLPLQQRGVRRQQRAAAAAEAAFSDVVACLLGLLGSELLPPLSLHTVGWLLNRLLSMGKGGATLSAGQRQALAAAVARHRGALQRQLQERWADALAPMVAAEWGRCRQAILRVGPGSVHVAVQTWMQAVLAQEMRWQQGTAEAGGAGAPDPSAVAAKQAYLAVQAAVAVVQLRQVLLEGDVPLDPPCPAVSSADVRQGEVREQAQIALGQSQRMHCTVCFARGQERNAYFAVEGLPAHVKAGQSQDLSLLKPSVLQQVAAAAPVLLLADPGTKPETALVLSVAPLMGALPEVDAKHPRWLHVQVRPPLRGLLKVLQGSHPGNALLNMQKHLVSGHWVVSFPDADRAASAAQHCQEWSHKMRAVYCQLLHPLLLDCDTTGAGGDAGGGASVPPGATL